MLGCIYWGGAFLFFPPPNKVLRPLKTKEAEHEKEGSVSLAQKINTFKAIEDQLRQTYPPLKDDTVKKVVASEETGRDMSPGKGCPQGLSRGGGTGLGRT